MKIKTMLGVWGVVAALSLCGGSLLAQDDNGGGPGGPGGPGGGGPGGPGGPGGGFDPAQFQQRMLDQTRQNLNVTNDEEWAVIQPLVQKVMEARREAGNGGGPGGPGGFGGPGGPGGRGGPGGPGGLGRKPVRNTKRCRRRWMRRRLSRRSKRRWPNTAPPGKTSKPSWKPPKPTSKRSSLWSKRRRLF